MKISKKLAAIILGVVIAIVGVAVIAFGNSCNNDGNTNSEQTQTQTVYVIKVVDASGAPVANAQVQLCAYKNGVSGELSTCYQPLATGADGKVAYNKVPSEGIYEIHVINQELQQIYTTPATYGEVTVMLK